MPIHPRRSCAIRLACAFLVFTAIPTSDPANAQRRAKQVRVASPPGSGAALYEWCRGAVFRRYGFRAGNTGMNLTYKGPMLYMNSDTVFARTELCVQTRGQTY